MSYESKMLRQLAMPTRKDVEQALLRALLKHDGTIKEFGSGEEIVDEIAGEFLQGVSSEVLERRLTKREIVLVGNSVGNYLDWSQAIEHAIYENIRE